MRSNTVKHALKEGRSQIGTWLTLGNPTATRFMARAGFDWLTVDLEHNPIGWETAGILFGQIADAGSIPLARVPFNDLQNAKRALDAGAYGIVFPMCNSVAEAEQAVSICKYPPQGCRSVGGGLHSLNFDCSPGEYYARANDEILVIVQAEHVDCVADCERIFRVPGIDGMFVGPNDLLSSMHKTPAMETDDPEFVAALDHLRKTAIACGIAPGIHTADAEAANRRAAEGWQFIAVASDLAFMSHRAREIVTATTGAQAKTVARY